MRTSKNKNSNNAERKITGKLPDDFLHIVGDIFKGKLAIFMYGIVAGMALTFSTAFFVTDNIYKERMYKLGTEILDKDETIKSLQKEIGLSKNIDTQNKVVSPVTQLPEVVTQYSTANNILGDSNKYGIEQKDLSPLVQRIISVINDCRTSDKGIKAKIIEYNNILEDLKNTLPDDKSFSGIKPFEDDMISKLEKLNTGSLEMIQKSREINDNIQAHLSFVYSYIKERYKKN